MREEEMPVERVVELGRITMQTTLLIGAPILAIATVISLAISIVQVLTSVQDATVATVPRLLAAAVAAVLLMPWMLRRLAGFTVQLFSDFHPFLH
jgi:flagellar biosynthetic protein FliQ